MASLTDVISAEAAEMVAKRLKIDLISEGYSCFEGGMQFTLIARLLLDDDVISESTANLYLAADDLK